MSLKLKYHFKCVRCEYETERVADMKTHCNRKKKCNWKHQIQQMSDNEVLKKSCERIYNDAIIIKKKINDKKELEETNDKNDLECEYCSKVFSYKYNLLKHMDRCKIKYIVEPISIPEVENKESPVTNVMNSVQIQNIGTQNISNIANISMSFVEKPVESSIGDSVTRSFHDQYDLSHISELGKTDVILKCSYEDIFKNVMENKNNMNHFFLNESESYVYEGEEKGFVSMDKSEINQQIVKKLGFSYKTILEELKEKKKLSTGMGSTYNALVHCFSGIQKNYLSASPDSYERQKIHDVIYTKYMDKKDEHEQIYEMHSKKKKMIQKGEEKETIEDIKIEDTMIEDIKVEDLVEKPIVKRTLPMKKEEKPLGINPFLAKFTSMKNL